MPRKIASWWLPIFILISAVQTSAGQQGGIAWQPWGPAAFEQARAGDKPVFLYLEAVWCHWCHVMQGETLEAGEVINLLNEHFVPVRVDHDAFPGLANRYRDFGWPALIWLDGTGQDLVKRAGYRSPENFSELLRAIIRDPSPEAAASNQSQLVVSGPSALSPAAREYLVNRHDQSADPELGGLRTAQKFIDGDSIEYALAHLGRPGEQDKIIRTLDSAAALIDPVWGGAYQYSTGFVWSNAHYEKIMRTQARFIRIYALSYARFGRPRDLEVAAAVQAYLREMLSSENGVFYVSQDADLVPGEKSHDYFQLDDAGRRRLGMPAIDKRQFSDANGLASEALALLYSATLDDQTLAEAVQAMTWVFAHRQNPVSGLLFHGPDENFVPQLGDSLHVARAALRLYEVSAERQWLARAIDLGQAIDGLLRAEGAGFLSAGPSPGVPLQPRPYLAENIQAARFFNRLHHYSGNERFGAAAQHAMRFLATHAEAKSDFQEIGIVLADEELSRDPPHLTVVGAKDDPVARALFRKAVQDSTASYRRVEWWDRDEGPLVNADIPFPALGKAAGFVCADGRCSRPSFSADDYAQQIRRLISAPVAQK